MVKELENIEAHFRELLKKGMTNLISDGIVNPEKYKNAKIKLLWILKEPHDKGNGGWDMRNFLITPENLTKRTDKWPWKKTYKNIMLSTWGILHDFQSYEKTLEDWRKFGDEEILSILNEIAYINLKKTPGKSKSYKPEIRSAYKKHQKLIWSQINAIKPDFAICGGTYEFIKKDIQLYNEHSIVFINNYHPGFIKKNVKSDKVYYQEILNEIKSRHLNNSLENCE